jgi:hypothetical protein
LLEAFKGFDADYILQLKTEIARVLGWQCSGRRYGRLERLNALADKKKALKAG